MIAIAVVGVLAFLVFLVSRYLRRPLGAAAAGVQALHGPRWYEFLLALILLLAVVVLAVWQFSADGLLAQAVDWRADDRAILFFVVMLIVAGLGLVAFLIYLIAESSRAGTVAVEPVAAPTAEPTASQPAVQTPSGVRLLGLLLLLAAFLLLNWIYLDRAEQYALVLRLLYPASLAVALVLLFDKASRTWNVKGATENLREWLLGDAMVFLLFLGFLNLQRDGGGEKYASMFWDVLYVALFFVVFWLLDRKLTRYRFLVVHAYFIALPILLLIWRAVQGVVLPETLSWWSSVWPFFFLAIIALVLEVIILLLPGSGERQVIPTIKDALYLVIYGVLLIVAIPEAAA
jgi:hypothetical protein